MMYLNVLNGNADPFIGSGTFYSRINPGPTCQVQQVTNPGQNIIPRNKSCLNFFRSWKFGWDLFCFLLGDQWLRCGRNFMPMQLLGVSCWHLPLQQGEEKSCCAKLQQFGFRGKSPVMKGRGKRKSWQTVGGSSCEDCDFCLTLDGYIVKDVSSSLASVFKSLDWRPLQAMVLRRPHTFEN